MGSIQEKKWGLYLEVQPLQIHPWRLNLQAWYTVHMLPILAGVLGTLFTLMWISLPGLQPWGLQATAALLLLYIFALRSSGKKWTQFLPPAAGLQSVFLTAAAGILVGSTGGTNSPFLLALPVTIFFCTLTLPITAVVVQSLGLTLVLWVTHPANMAALDWTRFLMLPLLLPVILLARVEMDQSKQSKHAEFLAQQKQEHQAKEALLFLSTLVGPKIQAIQLFLRQSPENRGPADQQLETLLQEIRSFSHELESDTYTPKNQS